MFRWIVAAGLACLSVGLLFAGDSAKPDTVRRGRYAVGGTPTISYDPDLGFKLGASVNLFDYGNRSKYPDFFQFLNLRGYASTKGTSLLSAVFESDKCLPASTVVAEVTRIRDTRLDFFGFNGANAIFSPHYISPEDSAYINTVYYAYQRVLTRLRADVYATLWGSHWRSLLGLTFQKFALGNIDFDKLNPPNGTNGHPAEPVSLYSNYLSWGVISPEQAAGGTTLSVMTGVSYDTRSNRLHSRKGVWFDHYLLTTRVFEPGEWYGKYIVSFRHYLELRRINALFTYRLSSQQKVFGEIPFYALPFFNDTRLNQDGYGGAATARGIYRNRLVADGYLSGNFELRQNLFRARFLTLNWQVALSGFTDVVYISQPYKTNLSGVPADARQRYFGNVAQVPAVSIGSGIYFVYNDNNVISATIGYSPDRQLGGTGIYILSAFHF